MQAAYRFFDNDKVTFAKVLQPHTERSHERVAVQPVVLLVQDTSEINLTRPEQEVAGVGDLDGSRRGFLLHEMQAFTPEGTPLGTVWAEIINRTEGVSHASAAQKRQQRKQLPIARRLRPVCRAASAGSRARTDSSSSGVQALPPMPAPSPCCRRW
jgi:hypothetical protein